MILILETHQSNLRSIAVSQEYERSDGFIQRVDIANVPLSTSRSLYQTPLHALNDGWKLIAPPVGSGSTYRWWFQQ